MKDQAELFDTLPPVHPIIPDLWILIFKYRGPGKASGRFFVRGPWVSETAARQEAERPYYTKWAKRLKIRKLT